MKKGRQDRIAETLTNVKGWVKGTPFTYKLLIDRIIQGKVKGEEIVHYNSSHTRISIPLYTTTILCSCVEPIACFTVSVSAYRLAWAMAS